MSNFGLDVTPNARSKYASVSYIVVPIINTLPMITTNASSSNFYTVPAVLLQYKHVVKLTRIEIRNDLSRRDRLRSTRFGE